MFLFWRIQNAWEKKIFGKVPKTIGFGHCTGVCTNHLYHAGYTNKKAGGNSIFWHSLQISLELPSLTNILLKLIVHYTMMSVMEFLIFFC